MLPAYQTIIGMCDKDDLGARTQNVKLYEYKSEDFGLVRLHLHVFRL